MSKLHNTLVVIVGVTGAANGSLFTIAANPDVAQSRSRESRSYRALIQKLQENGAKVTRTSEKVSQPFFAVPGRIIKLNDNPVQIFEYKRAADAAKDANLVSPDGTTIGTTRMMWVGTPHFFKTGNLILLFLGDDPKSLAVLKSALGDQFAGG